MRFDDRCRLVNYRYHKDKAIGTYVQNEGPALKSAHELRENTPGAFDKKDLDMGYHFARIPKIVWLDIQKLGIDNDIVAINRYLRILEARTGKNYIATKKRLI